MKTYGSLPSLFTESKLFPSQAELETTKKQLKLRLSPQKNPSEQARPSRALIHFQDNAEGFTSFKNINNNKIQQILNSLKMMRSSSTTIGRTIKAEILFNKYQYSKIHKYCENRKKSQKEEIVNRLAKLEPLPMKKEIKMTNNNKKKIKTVVGLKTDVNYSIYEANRLAWKPYIDFDAMGVAVGRKAYFIGGRKPAPLCYYDRLEDKWGQENHIQGLKPFGQSEGTVLSNTEIAFFGGCRFYTVGQSQPTNCLTIVDIQSKKARLLTFSQTVVEPRSFHAQCIYGEYLLISGGINRKHKLLNSFTAFHLDKKYWVDLTIAKIHDKIKEGFAKHKMMPILLPRRKYNIYEQQQIIASESQRGQISHEGIYIFGGEDSNVELSNKMYILTVGKPSIQVYEPVIKGKPPMARKNFDWVRIREFLIIQGGRNDQMRPWVLNSLVVLNLATMSWISIKGQKPSYRHSHTLLAGENQIVILGGKNMQGLCKQVFPLSFEEIIEYI